MNVLVRVTSCLARRIGSFPRDTRGAVAVSFALMAVGLTLAVAIVVDYSRYTGVKSKVEAAADAAALAGVSAGTIDRALSRSDQVNLSRRRAEDQFSGSMQALGVQVVSSQARASRGGNGEVVVNIDYTVNVPSGFGRLLSREGLSFSGKAEARSANVVYIDIVALVDASGSMGIGASMQDQQAMQASPTTRNCAFGCHVVGTDAAARALTRPNGDPVKLRFDVVRDALGEIVTEAANMHGASDQFRFSIYKFSNRFTTVRAPTTNLSDVTNALRSMELDGPGGAGTNFSASLRDLVDQVPAGGDGSSPTNRKVFFLILTDGIGDDVIETADAASYEWGRWVHDERYGVFEPSVVADGQILQGFDGSLCGPYRSKNINVMSLNIDYVIPPNPDYRFQTIRDQLKSSIDRNMRDCASRNEWVFNAGDPGSIHHAIKSMFDAVVASARLTR